MINAAHYSFVSKKTVRSPPHEPEERVRVTSVQRVLLETLEKGPQFPRSLLRARTFASLVEKGLAKENPDGSFEITQDGIEVVHGRKMGRPTKLTGPWLVLVSHYGGLERFSLLVHSAYNTVNRWSLHGVKPSGAAAAKVAELAEKAGLPNPLEEAS